MKRQKKRYLITGGAGFIGSNLIEFLLENDNYVACLDNLSSGKLKNLDKALSSVNFNFINEDVRTFSALPDLVPEFDIIVHLAASVGVFKCIANPLETIQNNIHSTEIILEESFKNNKKLILASSSEVYGKSSAELLTEWTPSVLGNLYQKRWSYAASKIIDEYMAMAYIRKGLDAYICRFFNVIGPRQNESNGVVPKFISQAQKGWPLTIYRDGSQMRCFTDIRDICDAVEKICYLEQPSSRVLNIGSCNQISIVELAGLIKGILDSESEIVFIDEQDLPEGFDDISSRIPDCSNLKRQTGWECRYSIMDSLLFTINETMPLASVKGLMS